MLTLYAARPCIVVESTRKSDLRRWHCSQGDKTHYDMLDPCDAVGVFVQVESRAQMNWFCRG